jgi:hypothetical protein
VEKDGRYKEHTFAGRRGAGRTRQMTSAGCRRPRPPRSFSRVPLLPDPPGS